VGFVDGKDRTGPLDPGQSPAPADGRYFRPIGDHTLEGLVDGTSIGPDPHFDIFA
jgi:hypothetical protein